MQFKIPQDVQRPDTIIGPITFAQLGICLVGGAIDYAIYLALAKTYYITVWGPPFLFIGLFTLAFAFLKIGDMSFGRYLIYLFEFVKNPRDRVWSKQDEYFYASFKPIIVTGKQDDNKDEEYLKQAGEKKEKLKEISKILDQ